jgi:hypothetical protein
MIPSRAAACQHWSDADPTIHAQAVLCLSRRSRFETRVGNAVCGVPLAFRRV